MTSIVMDTSSLISLEMIGLLKKSTEMAKIIIPAGVKNELEEMGSYKDKEGAAAKAVLEMVKNSFIETYEIKNSKKTDSLLSKNVNRGEAECFICCLERNIKILIMDDVDAAYTLEGPAIAGGIKIKICVAIIIELHKQHKISKANLKGHIKNLIKIREWEGSVLEVLADKYLENL